MQCLISILFENNEIRMIGAFNDSNKIINNYLNFWCGIASNSIAKLMLILDNT